jgi:hypothetical protein
MTKERLTDLKLESFSDRELMMLILDLRDADGTVTPEEIADRLDLDTPTPVRCVSSRLSWLRRYGILDRNRYGWYFTTKGEQIATAKPLSSSQQSWLSKLSPERGMDTTLMLGHLYNRYDGPEAVMMRRAWQYSISKRRRY